MATLEEPVGLWAFVFEITFEDAARQALEIDRRLDRIELAIAASAEAHDGVCTL